MQRFQKRREKVGENSFEALAIEDFDWGNEWVDPSLSQPQGARGCPEDNQDITWEDVDVAIGASSNLRAIICIGQQLHFVGARQMSFYNTTHARDLLQHDLQFLKKMRQWRTWSKSNTQVCPTRRGGSRLR